MRLSKIASDLKQLAQERNVIVISPTQVVKSSYKKDKIDLEDINESGGKAHVSDAVMILNGSEENFNDGLISLFIAKNRHGKAYKSIIFKIDFDKMLFIDTGRIGDIIHDEDDDNSEYYKNTVFTKVK
ncbi:MAG TPA: DnaB-like helicase C-terminal domain-containing protein [Bacilli bacterium]|nr:DnaB-like helicase C-terminal domain-containing protein [Bacilli bacterium]